MATTLLLLLLVLGAVVSRGDDDRRYDTSMCNPNTCKGMNISYPFYLTDKTTNISTGSTSCGYPGMGIRCDADRGALLQLDGDVTVVVTSIGDSIANVSLSNYLDINSSSSSTNSCPTLNQNVTLSSSSWLKIADGSSIEYLDFFSSCTAAGTPLMMTCGAVVFPEKSVPPGIGSMGCKLVRVPVLKLDPVVVGGANSSSSGLSSEEYSRALRSGFPLRYAAAEEPCKRCENSDGRCGYNNAAQFIGCLCKDGRVSLDLCNSTIAAAPAGSKKNKSSTTAGAVGGAIAGALLLAAAAAAVICIIRKRKVVASSSSKLLTTTTTTTTALRSRSSIDMESSGIDNDDDPQTTHHRFSYEVLEAATDSFSDRREIGDGGFGTVYKGYLADGRVVAVKRLHHHHRQVEQQFINEADILSRLRHPNLVMFYGCTSSHSRELLLVYEFVRNGTVADHLHGARAPERALDWPRRLAVAVEAAAALTYLHAVDRPVVHRDVKTTNILLDVDFHVKVADFGLSRLFPLDVTHVSTAPQGTPGYVDPEYHQCYQLTDKSDVYSFGVVLVELISSKPAVDITRNRNEINLAAMAISKIQNGQLDQLLDHHLGYNDDATRKTMMAVSELAFRCLQQNGEMRPAIKEVHDVLRGIQEELMLKKVDLDPPFSPDTVHAPWDSRTTTPSVSQ